MGVPGKTRGHSIDIVLGGSRNNRGIDPNSSMANFNEGLKKAAADGKLDNNPKFKAAVENATITNRAGSPVRMMNNNMINQTDMGQMPFQNGAIVNAQGMKQFTEVNPNIPGALPGSGNVPGNQYVPNPVARMKNPIARTEGEKPFVPTGTVLPELDVEYSPSGSGKSYNASTGEERDSTKVEMEEQRKTNMSKGDGRVTTSYVDPNTGEKKKLGSLLKASF